MLSSTRSYLHFLKLILSHLLISKLNLKVYPLSFMFDWYNVWYSWIDLVCRNIRVFISVLEDKKKHWAVNPFSLKSLRSLFISSQFYLFIMMALYDTKSFIAFAFRWSHRKAIFGQIKHRWIKIFYEMFLTVIIKKRYMYLVWPLCMSAINIDLFYTCKLYIWRSYRCIWEVIESKL